MLQKIVQIFGGDPNKRQIERFTDTVDYINGLETQFERYSNDELRAKTGEFRRRLALGETLDDLLPEAFATVREASKRHLGQRHFDVQLIGGIVLHQGIIAEMRTGEGKTLVATLPLYLNALTLNPAWIEKAQQSWGDDPEDWSFTPIEGLSVGRGNHLVTVNDYLARRDARWMGSIYLALGLEVGVLQMAARTENGKKAFLVDFERESPHEDQHNLRMVPRGKAYAADITYGTNSEFGFDYLRDNMTLNIEDRVQRGHHYAIIDEVDNVLIDEARTPLIISGPSHDDAEWYVRMSQVAKSLRSEDYEISERDRTVTLTELGETHVENLLDMPLWDPERPEDVTPEQAHLMGFLEQSLRAQYLFKKNKDYLVQAGKVIIIDEFTGRLMPGRRWSDGLHQAVEAKEGARVQPENVTYATITIQNYFRMYEKLAGMTGTALTESEEFKEIYELDVLAIPTNLEYLASREDTDLTVLEARDEAGYKYQYYADIIDPEREPLFWKRKDYPDVVYRTEEAKLRAIVQEILRYHILGRPILVGTTSVELSEKVSGRLKATPMNRLAQTLLLRQVWMEQHNRVEDGRLVPELTFLNLPLSDWDRSKEAEVRNMARDLGISSNPASDENLDRLLASFELSSAYKDRLESCLKAGIPHNVLNAKEHTAESKIIARAGELGMINIATNMAGRGVDIKLGGEQAEDLLVFVNDLLRGAGVRNSYSMTNIDRLAALKTILLKEFNQIPADENGGFKVAPPEDLEAVKGLLLEKYGSDEAKDEWPQLTNILYNFDKNKFPLRTSEKIIDFWRHVEKEIQVRDLGGLHVIGSERHESRRIDNQLRGRAARQGDPGSSRFYLSMEDELMRLFGGQQAENMMGRLKIDEAMPLEMGLVGRIVEQSQGRVEGANFDVRKHLLEYDDVLNTQRTKIYDQRDRIFSKDDLSEDVTDMLQTEVLQRVPLALEDEEGPWKLLAWLDQIQPPLPVNGRIYPSYTLRLLVDEYFKNSGNGNSTELAFSHQEAYKALLDLAGEAIKAEEKHLLHSINKLIDITSERMEAQLEERLDMVEVFFDGLELDEETDRRDPRKIMDELSNLVRVPIKLTSEEQRALRSDGDRSDLEQIVDRVSNQVEATLIDQSITRLVGAVERRLEEDLDIDRDQLSGDDWEALAEQVLSAISSLYERRLERLIGQDGDGLIAKDIESALAKFDGPVTESILMGLLLQMPQGAVATFDKRTHRRVWQRTTRLTYIYVAAGFLESRHPDEIASEVLEHLEEAQSAMRLAWGRSELKRLESARPIDLDTTTQNGLRDLLGEERFEEISDQELHHLEGEERTSVVDELGRQALTEVYRQLLLRVISELWVDYLTSMEALRISIGLEAYAQRDPLVEYKNRAFEMFQELLSNMRMGVVTRMFTFRPHDLSSVQTTVTKAEPPQIKAEPQPQAQGERRAGSRPTKSKRRRRRR